MTRLAVSVLRVLVALGAVGTTLAFFGGLSWVADLFTHFRPHYAVGLLASACFGFALGSPRLGVVAVLLATVNAGVVAAALQTVPAAPAGSVGPIVRVMTLNVNRFNEDYEAIAALIAAVDPDVLGLVEAHGDLLTALEPATVRYMHTFTRPQADCFGQALFSRHPLDRVRVARLGTSRAPALVADIDVDGAPATFVLLHPDPPMTRDRWLSRDTHFTSLAANEHEMHPTLIICGDLNTTPWSPGYQSLVEGLDLVDTGQGLDALHGTWPSALGPLGIAIDHCLVTRDVVTLRHQVERDVGSDHRPLVVELGLPVPSR